jgi:hypothetical protein
LNRKVHTDFINIRWKCQYLVNVSKSRLQSCD